MLNNILDSAKGYNAKWPSILATIEFSGDRTEDDFKRKEKFYKELYDILDKLQERSNLLPKEKKFGHKMIAEIAFCIDMSKKEVVLNRLYKYCDMDFHLFEELAEMLHRNFPEFTLVVPALEGYELAEEIYRHIGEPEIDCIYLKGDFGERLVAGEDIKEVTFEGILEDTEKYYAERGGMKKKKDEIGCGMEITMRCRGEKGEEEVIWMLVKSSLSGYRKNGRSISAA